MRLYSFKKLYFNFTVFLTVLLLHFSFSPVLAENLISNINEVPVLNLFEELRTETAQEMSLASAKNIAVLYKEPKENNIAALNIPREEIISGVSLSSQVDVLKVQDKATADELLKNIEANENVLAASYDELIQGFSADPLPNDPYYNYMYHLKQTGSVQSWNKLGDGQEIKVAVIDTGVMSDHEDLAGRVEQGLDLVGIDGQDLPDVTVPADKNDYLGHGTAVASAIVANANNGKGITGITGQGNVKVVSYKAMLIVKDQYNSPYTFASAVAASCMDILNRGDIKIVNLSGGSVEDSLDVTILRKSCELLRDQGILIFAAAGNTAGPVSYPAMYDSVIAVGATNDKGTHAVLEDWVPPEVLEEHPEIICGSNFGPEMDLAAPGTNLLLATARSYAQEQEKSTPGSVINNDYNYAKMSGTSFSCPVAAGVCAALWSMNPDLSSEQIKEILYNSAEDTETPGKDIYTGYGIVRLDRALNLAQNYRPKGTIQFDQTAITLLPGQSISLNALASDGYTPVYSVYNPGIAQINENGVLNAVSPGETTLKISMKSMPTVTKSCKVTVMPVVFTESAHISEKGWTEPETVNSQVLGNPGAGIVLEALRLNSCTPGVSIVTQVYSQDKGWLAPVKDSETAGTTGEGKALQALKISLSGENSNSFKLNYRVCLKGLGWTQWVNTGEPSGSSEPGNMIEAVQIIISPSSGNPVLDESNLDWSFKGTI